MNGKKIKRAAGCIITIGLIVFFLGRLTGVLGRKIADIKYTAFFEEEEDFDVLFFGTSHIKYGISPMELWHNYGIVSYNFGTNQQLLPTTYWQMENVLDYTSPKLIVIDCFFLASSEKATESLHDTLDAIPLSRTKLNALSDLIGNGERGYAYKEFIWDYYIYHNRWNELKEEDFEQVETYAKGGDYIVEIETGDGRMETAGENKLETDSASVEYLEKMIEDCQRRGIEVLLVYMPASIWADAPMEADRVYDIAGQYGVNYINFLDLNVVNDKVDYSDDNHMNLAGCRKVTDYLGQYIMEHYDIADQRDNAAFEDWNMDYEDYRNAVNTDLKSYESLDYYMLFLHNKNYLTFVEINNPEIWNNDYYCDLFESLGVNQDEITSDTDLLIIQNAGGQVEYLEKFRESEQNVTTELGEIQIFASESGTYGVYLEGDEIYAVTEEENRSSDIQIVIVDKDTREVVDRSSFAKRADAGRQKAARIYTKTQ